MDSRDDANLFTSLHQDVLNPFADLPSSSSPPPPPPTLPQHHHRHPPPGSPPPDHSSTAARHLSSPDPVPQQQSQPEKLASLHANDHVLYSSPWSTDAQPTSESDLPKGIWSTQQLPEPTERFAPEIFQPSLSRRLSASDVHASPEDNSESEGEPDLFGDGKGPTNIAACVGPATANKTGRPVLPTLEEGVAQELENVTTGTARLSLSISSSRTTREAAGEKSKPKVKKGERLFGDVNTFEAVGTGDIPGTRRRASSAFLGRGKWSTIAVGEDESREREGVGGGGRGGGAVDRELRTLRQYQSSLALNDPLSDSKAPVNEPQQSEFSSRSSAGLRGSTHFDAETAFDLGHASEAEHDESCPTHDSGLEKDSPLSDLDITVSDPIKVGDPIKPFILYKVRTIVKNEETGPRQRFRQRVTVVSRRYRDFLWLYECLASEHAGVIVPPVPNKQAVGRFQDEFVENRRIGLERCLRRMSVHEVIREDAWFLRFLQMDDLNECRKMAKEAGEKWHGGSGRDSVGARARTLGAGSASNGVFSRAFSSFGDVSVFSKPLDSGDPDMDQFIDKQLKHVTSVETQLRALLRTIEALIKARREVGIACADFGETLLVFANGEGNKRLVHKMAILSGMAKRAKGVHERMAQCDAEWLESTVDEYVRISGSVRVAVAARARAVQVAQHTRAVLGRKEDALARLKSKRPTASPSLPSPASPLSSSPPPHSPPLPHNARLEHLQRDIIHLRACLEDQQRHASHVTALLTRELERVELERVRDFQRSVYGFLVGTVAAQRQMVGLWRQYLRLTTTSMGTSTTSTPRATGVGVPTEVEGEGGSKSVWADLHVGADPHLHSRPHSSSFSSPFLHEHEPTPNPLFHPQPHSHPHSPTAPLPPPTSHVMAYTVPQYGDTDTDHQPASSPLPSRAMLFGTGDYPV